ncbi:MULTISPECIES: carboxypeptidase-like regulatory domain-containing protein [unclassified Nocardioides]|uniref:carboxypeptidase-like regulatory domain-containing protein n=1 Tax=unclassified Nocardioides TaxID=2615069 RepID=UPI0006FE83EF|nr:MULTISPECIES: carboxypeptidase-like regulatory domain-containing protein [unclassified Nocardioides]KRA32583.1 hypothetical protein ASD81_13665 [Nocardioides sp. Root614]KRA89236.1 hypothetical protein ASD84_13930 [Nocardioides sp. Root682]
MAVAALALLLVLPLTPTHAQAAAADRTISIQVPSATTTGAAIAVRGRVTRSPKGSPVVLRRKSGTRWVKVASTRTTNRYGSFELRIRAPGTGGTYRYRASAPRTASAPAVVSVARSVVVRVQVRASLAASNLTPVAGSAITLSGLVSPWLAATPVVLQKRVGTSTTWATVRSIWPDSTGRFRLSDTPLAGVVSRYRVSVSARTYRTSAVSSAVTVTPVASGPAVVTSLKAASTSKQVKLSWTNPAGTTGVTVRRAVGSTPPATAGAGAAVPTTGVVSAATDSAVEEDQSYAYSVFATTSSGTSPPVSTARPGPAPATAGWHTAVPGKITFHWTNPAGVDHVAVDVRYDSGVWLGGPGLPPSVQHVGAVDTYTVSGLPSQQWVYLWIYTLDAAGNFQGSYRIGAQSPQGTDTPSGPVTDPTADALPRAVTLRWTNPESAPWSDVAISRIEGAVAPASPTSGWVVGRTRSTETTTDEMVAPGHTYTYGLWAVDSSGNYSTRASVTVTTPQGAPPGPVTGLTATALAPTVGEGTTGYDPQRVRLRWTNPSGADAIVVARAEGPTAPASPLDGGGWNLPLPVDTLLDNELEADTEYSYAVWAVGQDGTYSTLATVTVRSDPNAARPVSGRVVDSRSGAAVGSVPLTFRSNTDAYPTGFATFTTTSESDGSYDLDLPVGGYTACVDGTSVTGGSPQGYVDSCSELTVASVAATSQDLPINQAVSLRGVVREASTGRPIAGATVIASRPYPYLYDQVVTTTADDGSYLVTGVSSVASTITWVRVDATTATNGTAQGYEPEEPVVKVTTSLPGETVQQDLTITPLRVVTISGRATSATGGTAVPGVGVHIVGARGAGVATPLAHTGADGRYSVTTALGSDDSVSVCFDAERHLTPGAATGYGNQCFGGADFEPGVPADPSDRSVFGTATPVSVTSQVDVALVRTATVSGKVTAPGDVPLAGVPVSLRKHSGEVRRTVTTDATGRFTVSVGAPSTGPGLPITVCADTSLATGGSSSGGYASPSCLERTIYAAPPTTGVDFVAQPAATLTGKVEDSVSGAPVAEMTVELHQQYVGNVVRSATTDATGSYALTQIRPEAGKTYLLCASGVGRATACVPVTELGVPQLSVGSTFHAEVVSVDRHGSISGVLTGADTGEPIPDVLVTLGGGSSTTTDAEGRYSFTRLPPGQYGLIADRNTSGPRGYRTTMSGGFSIAVTPGQDTTADLAMQPAAAVRVKVVTPDGRPAPGVSLAVRDELGYLDVQTDAQGFGTVKGLAPTDYPVHEAVCAARGQVGPGTRAGYTPGCGWMPTLTNGRTATTTIVVGFEGVFGAWVRDAVTGKPIDGARVELSVPNGDYYATHIWDTDSHGFSYPYHAVNAPNSGIALNPSQPRFQSARICVSAHGYAPTCFRGGAPDGQSGPLLRARPGMRTIATFALTPN